MPPLSKLSLKEISAKFLKTDEFYFLSYKDGQLTFFCEKEFTYKLTFFPCAFADLKQPCFIDDLTAAIDTNEDFSISLDL